MCQKTLAIILNWNELEYTRRCIESLISQSVKDIRILVIDNHSVKDPTGILNKEYPNVTVIRNFKNMGVAGGRNIGVRYAIENKFKYILLFDSDAYADSKLIESFLVAADKYPDTALFGSKIYFDNDKHIIWRAGCTSWKWTYLHAGYSILVRFCRLFRKSLPSWADTGRGENQKDTGQYDQIREISFQIGCCQFIRTKIFNEIGFLDTDYIPYGSEDIDFCARLSKKGWKITFIPSAICWHRVGSSFTDNYRRSFFNTRNIILLARKNLHPIYFSFLFVPDFMFLTTPLVILEGLFFLHKNRLEGFLDGIVWNFSDIMKRGVLLRDRYNPNKMGQA